MWRFSRLTLFVAGEIHALIEPFQRWLADQVRQAATDDGLADTAKLAGLMLVVEPRWAEVMRQYASLLRAARVQAADVGFTSLRVKNNARFDEWVVRGEEEGGQRLMVNGQRSMVNGPGGRPGGAVLFEGDVPAGLDGLDTAGQDVDAAAQCGAGDGAAAGMG